MKKIILIVLIALGFSPTGLAHDGGHGPKIADSGKYGGLVAAMVDRKDAKLGDKAALIYKAELVRSTGKVRLYLYDAEMKPLDTTKFGTTVKATLASQDPKTKKYTDIPFDLTLDGKSFAGQMPPAPTKTYNLDFIVKENDRELLTAFDNLD